MTALDQSRRYLVPVGPLGLRGEPDHTHLAVMDWNTRIEEWLTGVGVCGRSTAQGPLAAGTVATCPDCVEYQPVYEAMLGPCPALEVA